MAKHFISFLRLSVWLKVVLFFCLFGALVNLTLVCEDVISGGILLRLHAGFFILYAGQVVFILLRERFVFILALLQAVLALWSNADFTFAPLIRLVGRLYYLSHQMTVQELSVYKYVFISLAFTLELFKAYLIFHLLPAPAAKKEPQQEA